MIYDYKVKDKSGNEISMEGFYKKLQRLGFSTSGDDIKWNFTKLLVDRKGKVIARYAPTVEPEKIDITIKALLENK